MSTTNFTPSLALGRIAKTLTPSGRTFVIREQNGNDDDILSNAARQSDLSNLDDFLNAIILHEIVKGKEKPVTFTDIIALNGNDRAHLLLFSRIHTLGPIMKFQYDWGDDPKKGGKFDYEEDLSLYIHDYTKDYPQRGEEGYFKYKIPPYPKNSYDKFSIQTTSGKNLRYNVYNREAEKFILNGNLEITNNTELIARNLELEMGTNEWIKVENFAMFSKKDMIEIHRAVNEVDPNHNLFSEITHPTTKQVINFPILRSQDFFFPMEI